MDKFFRLKINKETVDLNDTLDQVDLIDIFGVFHLKASEYAFLSNAYEAFFKVDHKTHLNKF